MVGTSNTSLQVQARRRGGDSSVNRKHGQDVSSFLAAPFAAALCRFYSACPFYRRKHSLEARGLARIHAVDEAGIAAWQYRENLVFYGFRLSHGSAL
jgi:hypothetical protein